MLQWMGDVDETLATNGTVVEEEQVKQTKRVRGRKRAAPNGMSATVSDDSLEDDAYEVPRKTKMGDGKAAKKGRAGKRTTAI